MTLVNAKNAGYLDRIASGQYRLNPVGHNLVTHKLPRGENGAQTRGEGPRDGCFDLHWWVHPSQFGYAFARPTPRT
jgi:hypothetical protein